MKIIIETDSYALVNALSRAIKRYQRKPLTGETFRAWFDITFDDDEAAMVKPLIAAISTEHNQSEAQG